MDLEAAWEWFLYFGQFFVIAFGPIIIAALPILIAEGILLGVFFAFMSTFDLGD